MSAPAQSSSPSPATRPETPPAFRRPELLAPAGDWECARAAVENGADAIYFGLERFNARMRAKNFTQADLPGLMEFLHRRGVRGYVTFNTLIFTAELAEAEDYLRTIIAAGVDAAIVQDIGACRLIRALSPDFPIHCSTQMTVTSGAGVAFARELGAQLVVLARENSLEDIAKINAAQAAAEVQLPLEVFVHGALCVAYSGQCLTSESLGGRSANRGECAQACRLPYDLIADGHQVPLGDRRYLLSPQDLSGLEVLPDLVRAGVSSLKIEGRLKSPEYVASITRVYRQALDKVMADLTGTAVPRFEPQAARYELEMSFSRGLYPGWFRGINNQELAHARFGTSAACFSAKCSASPAKASRCGCSPRSSPATASCSTPASLMSAKRAAGFTRSPPPKRAGPPSGSATAISTGAVSGPASSFGKPMIPPSTAMSARPLTATGSASSAPSRWKFTAAPARRSRSSPTMATAMS